MTDNPERERPFTEGFPGVRRRTRDDPVSCDSPGQGPAALSSPSPIFSQFYYLPWVHSIKGLKYVGST